MQEEKKLSPDIQLHLPIKKESVSLGLHVQAAQKMLAKVLPETYMSLSRSEQVSWLSENLPLLHWDEPQSTPESLSIFCLLEPTHEVAAEKVLPDLIRKWLIPEKEVLLLGFQNIYFHMKDLGPRLFFLAEVKVLVEQDRDLTTIKNHLPLLSNELGLSLSSKTYLERVLDTKALALDQKSTQIQGYLRKAILRMPEQYDVTVLQEMSTFFAISKPDFRKARLPKHLTRVIASHYLMRKRLYHELSIAPEQRHLEVRILRSKLHFPFGAKPVLGISIAVGLNDRYESFDESHILEAVQKFLPNAHLVKGSYYFYQPNHDRVKCIYLEIEKRDGSMITSAEVGLLKSELEEELKKRVERLIPSVFMIRNEEEVMRNILLLSQELNDLSDLPQVMVNFDRQEGEELSFTILIVRVKGPNILPLEKAFATVDQPFRFLTDRIQNVGLVKKKVPKEANVCHLYIPKDRSILRANSSVNYYLVRQKIIAIITSALGEIRDYNGGMILKQGELFAQFKDACFKSGIKNQEFLENFFFSLTPIEAQATLKLSTLEKLLHLVLETGQGEINRRESFCKRSAQTDDYVYVAIRSKDPALEKFLQEEFSEEVTRSLVKTQVRHQGTLMQGFLYECADQEMQQRFFTLVNGAIEKWKKKVLNQQVLRVSFAELPPSLDPRLAGADTSSTLMKMLFEGLTRISKGSKPTLAIAKTVDISADQKRYTFSLRNTFWSDGSPLEAYDFEYAWKKVLSPSFYTAFSYLFHPIKNARAAKEGLVELDAVGVKAINDSTLVVELEHPAPEFLELTAHALYSPIMHKLEELHPNWAEGSEELYVCNGPFKLKSYRGSDGYEFEKNPFYYDKGVVKIEQILISKETSETALERFQNEELEWLGQPFRAWDGSFENANDTKLVMNTPSTQWCLFNTQRFPFDNLKMRQAFCYAIDRKQLASHLFEEFAPASTPLPLPHTRLYDEAGTRGDKELARKLFDQALSEMGLTRKNFPLMTLYCFSSKIRWNSARELIKQWEEVFEVPFRMEKYEFQLLFPKLTTGEFQLATLPWKSWINNPIYTLNLFQYRANQLNFSRWEHPKYQELLEKAYLETDINVRNELFKEAERILMRECPVFSMNYEKYISIYKGRLRDVFFSDTGNIDFKRAYILPE